MKVYHSITPILRLWLESTRSHMKTRHNGCNGCILNRLISFYGQSELSSFSSNMRWFLKHILFYLINVSSLKQIGWKNRNFGILLFTFHGTTDGFYFLFQFSSRPQTFKFGDPRVLKLLTFSFGFIDRLIKKI